MANMEKTAQHEQLEKVRTEEELEPQNRRESMEKVLTHETLAKVDIHNKQAFKGDESDGKVLWSIRQWLAAGFLAMLYTGTASTG